MATCGSRLLRTCRGEAFAKAYEESTLKRSNDEELEAALQQHSSLNKDTLKELSVTQATVTPFWWALFVMFKVRCQYSVTPPDQCMSMEACPCSQGGRRPSGHLTTALGLAGMHVTCTCIPR